MDGVLGLALVVVGVSASGVMAPGPLFAANVSYGIRRGARAGIWMAAGHAAVELPLVALLGAGALSLAAAPRAADAVSVLGAAALFGFAAVQAYSAARPGRGAAAPARGPLLAGAALSALNPFFVAWWLTVGLKLVSDAAGAWGFAGVLGVFGLHIWMDFAWMGAVAFLASRGAGMLSPRNRRVLTACLSVPMAYFGVLFLLDSGLVGLGP